MKPQVNGLADSLGTEGQIDFPARSGGLIPGIENFLDDPTILACGLRLVLAVNGAGEVMHLLRKSIVP